MFERPQRAYCSIARPGVQIRALPARCRSVGGENLALSISNVQQVIIGAVIILAVSVDELRKRRLP